MNGGGHALVLAMSTPHILAYRRFVREGWTVSGGGSCSRSPSATTSGAAIMKNTQILG